MALFFYILLKRKNRNLFTLLIAFALRTAPLLLSVIFAFVPSLEVLVLPLSILIAVIFNLAIFRLGNKARNTAVIFYRGTLGVFFGDYIQFLGEVLILAFLAVYDVLAVYYGLVGKIAHLGLNQLLVLSYSFEDVQTGLGELEFFNLCFQGVCFSILA